MKWLSFTAIKGAAEWFFLRLFLFISGYIKAKDDAEKKAAKDALEKARLRMEIDWTVSAMGDADLDDELNAWLRAASERPDER